MRPGVRRPGRSAARPTATARRWTALATFLGALAVTVSGFAAGVLAPPAGAATGPQVTNTAYGFAFTLPAGWQQVPLTTSDINGLLNSAAKVSPSIASGLDSQIRNAAAHGIKVFAVGPITAASTPPNLNLSVQSASGLPKGRAFLSAAGPAARSELAATGAKQLTTSVVKFRGGKAVELRYLFVLKTGNLSGLQLYARHKSHVYIVTVTSPDQSANASVAKVVAGSWRWL